MRLTALSFALAALPFAALAQEVTVETYAGPVAVPANPSPVIALDLAAVDAMQALGIPLVGVPDITPPAYLADILTATPKVGTLFEPDFEMIAGIAPGIIIAGGRSQEQVGPLSEIAPTIDMTIWGDDLVDQAKARMTAYGTIFAMEDEAAALNAALDAAVTAAQDAAAGKGETLILMTSGGNVAAYGDDSRFGWLHSVVGLPEAFPDLTAETHGESVSFEFIAEVDPDWILVVDRSAAIGEEAEAAAATLDNPLVAGTKAGQAGHIIYLDSASIYLAGGGVTALTNTMNQLAEAFGG